jgi:hypothetical protein
MTRPSAFASPHPNYQKFWRLSFGLACACAALFTAMLGGAAAADQQHIGAATRVVHTVTGALAPEPPVVLRAGIDVFANEVVKTAENSAALLVFQDQTELSIGANSEIVLDRFVFDPDPAKSAIAVSIVTGVARFSTGLLPKSAYTIRTPTATLAVRGTTLTVTVGSEEQPERARRRRGNCNDPLARTTEIDVTEGTVFVAAQGETVQLERDQSSTVPCGEPPSAPFASPPSSPATTQMDTLLQQAALQNQPSNVGNAVTVPPGATPRTMVVSPSHIP